MQLAKCNRRNQIICVLSILAIVCFTSCITLQKQPSSISEEIENENYDYKTGDQNKRIDPALKPVNRKNKWELKAGDITK
jgi:hypothetical protein